MTTVSFTPVGDAGDGFYEAEPPADELPEVSEPVEPGEHPDPYAW